MYNPTAHPVTLRHLDPRPTSERYAITPEGHVRAHRHSRIKLTPGPQGKSDEEEDWGEWKSDGRRAHGDQRRPARLRCLPLKSVHPRTALCCCLSQFDSMYPILAVIASSCRVEEIAIVVNDVLYYTLPSIAALVFPEPEQWKKSRETVYRSLMPHRRSIIEDEQRVKSISEFPFSPPPHGVPGR